MPDEQSCNFVRRSRPQSHPRGSARAGGLRPCPAAARGRPPARWRARFHRLVFAQGFYSADEALPERLPLLHVCSSAARERARVPLPRRSAGHRAGGACRGLQGGTVHARRPGGAALSNRRRRARPARTSHDLVVSGAGREQTGLFPHLNPGHLTPSDVTALRVVSLSQGLMLESVSERLCERGGPHYGSPDKHPQARLASIRAAGEQRVPFTSGILIGIGETREERIDSLLALRALNDAYGHIQEIIIQNFRPKPATRMANWPAPSLEDHLWTIAIARLLFAPSMNIQAPPNLN